MPSIDNRVVEMEFQNSQFNNGIKSSVDMLDKLKKSLKLEDSVKGLSDLEKSAKNVDLSSISNGVRTIADRFSTMGIIATTALTRIANTAITTGSQLVKSLSLDGIMDGFREYELQIGSIQTILGNTKSKGTTLDQVNAALDELNTYADQTIYNFGQMTENIGRFTAAGVDLDKSVASIKGISNLAALSGSSSAQAASAMYQLSQGIAAGKIQLMDWNSVVNAGMGGEQFQNALKRTAEHFGTNVDEMIEKYGSFRESLTRGEWLTADVMTETLKQLSGAYTEADLIAQGYTEQQAKEIVDLANTATEAATKVRTFSQLFSTIKEAVGSGWAQTWRILIGDFEEATDLFTEINDVVSNFVNGQADARNALLQTWKDLGGRTDIIDGFRSAFESLSSIVGTISQAFHNIFPPATAQQLKDISSGFKDLMNQLKPSEKTLNRISRIATGLFSAFDLLRQAVLAILSPIGSLIGSGGFGGLLDIVLEVAASIGDFFTALDKGAKQNDIFGGLGDALSSVASKIGSALSSLSKGIGGFGEIFSYAGETISNVATKIKNALKDTFEWISENVSLNDVFAGIGVGSLAAIAGSIGSVVDKIKDAFSGLDGGGGLKDIADKFSDILGSVHDTLETFQTGIKVGSIVAIAAAIAILAGALNTISKIKASSLVKALGGISIMFVEMTAVFKSMSKTLSRFDTKGIVKAGVAMIAVAKAMDILADAITKISKLPLDKLAVGLAGVSGGLAELVVALKFLNGKDISLKTSVAILAVAKACKMLAEAVSSFSGLSWEEISKGLSGMGGALGELTIALSILSKAGGGGALLGSAAILVAVQSLDEIAENLKKVGALSWDEIKKGLAGIGGALAEIAALSGILGKATKVSGILGAGAILVGAQALDEISENLERVGKLSWEEIGKGLSGIGGALAEIAALSGILGKVTKVSGILGSGAILLGAQALDPIAQALDKVSDLSWEEIGKGLTGIGGALAEIAAMSGVLGTVSGISGILGSGTILIAAQALYPIAVALNMLSGLTWENVQIGLTGIGGALGELALMSGVLGTVSGLSGLLGSGSILIAAQALGPIANAFLPLSTLSWDAVQVGLAAMGGALAEVAVGSIATGIAGVAGLVGAGSITLASQGLGQLADAFIKFGSMDWESVKSGLVAMGAALGETALGSLLNTLSGFGAGAIATVAEPLGALADSVKKWGTVSVPEGLAEQLGSLSSGIQSFTLSGFGGGAIATVAEPLGTMATSVAKWANVTVPDDIQTNLEALANGVTAFTLSGIGGASMNLVIEPLGNLAGSVKKWKGVIVPKTIKEDLENLAGGVGAFWASGFSVGGLNSVIEPLGNLAGSVKKWKGVSVPENIQTQLDNLSQGIKKFDGTATSASAMDTAGTALKQVASAVSSLTGLDFSGVSANLQAFATSLQTLPEGFSVAATNIGVAMSLLASSLSLAAMMISMQSFVINAAVATIKMAVSGISTVFSSQAGAVSIAIGFIAASVSAGMGSIAAAVTNGTSTVMAQFSSLAVSLMGVGPLFILAGTTVANGFVMSSLTAFKVGETKFRQSGQDMGQEFKKGLSYQQAPIVSVCRDIASAAANAMSSFGNAYFNAGKNAAQGFANGIAQGASRAINAAAKMAADAVAAAKDKLGEHSPSRVFRQIGLFAGIGAEQGFEQGAPRVEKAASSMASRAVSAANEAMASISDMIDSGATFSLEPTITPVIDFDNLNQGSMKIDHMFNRSIELSASVASSIAQKDRKNIETPSSKSGDSSKEPTTVNFTQNNYSPKALSRIDIYRDTKNQLSRMKKGALN